MTTRISTPDILSPKRTTLADAFLLYRYKHASTEQKRTYESKTRAERIARTMRLEGEQVTTDDVRKQLNLP